jgi:hypothetical protein
LCVIKLEKKWRIINLSRKTLFPKEEKLRRPGKILPKCSESGRRKSMVRVKSRAYSYFSDSFGDIQAIRIGEGKNNPGF